MKIKEIRKEMIDGQLVAITILKPSKRRAHATIQKKGYVAHNGAGQSAAVWLAWENGSKVIKDD